MLGVAVGLALVASTMQAREAAAHAVGLSRGAYVVRRAPGNVRVLADLVFAPSDASLLTLGEDVVTVTADDTPCVPDANAANAPFVSSAGDLDAGDGLRVHLAWTCPNVQRVIVALPFLARAEAIGATHRHIATAGGTEELLFAGHDRFTVDVPTAVTANASDASSPATSGGAFSSFVHFVALGSRHVLGGADHLAFVVGLVLCGGSLAELARVVTAFTVAHSTTLALATFGLVTPSARFVEPLVALSVAYVGCESLVRQRRGRARTSGSLDKSASGWRGLAAVAFGFGLVHGLAFADALRSLGLRGGPLARALVGFNGGVEVAQLLVLLAIVPLVRRVRRSPRAAPLLLVASASVAIAGMTWFVLRLR